MLARPPLLMGEGVGRALLCLLTQYQIESPAPCHVASSFVLVMFVYSTRVVTGLRGRPGAQIGGATPGHQQLLPPARLKVAEAVGDLIDLVRDQRQSFPWSWISMGHGQKSPLVRKTKHRPRSTKSGPLAEVRREVLAVKIACLASVEWGRGLAEVLKGACP